MYTELLATTIREYGMYPKGGTTVTFSLLRFLRKSIIRSVPKAKGSDQKVVTLVMQGFRATLEDGRFEVLVPRLNEVEAEWRGFAYEGVGLGFAIFDYFLPWRKRLQAFVHGPGAPYIIPIYIGAGLALGRLIGPRGGRRLEWFVSRLENPVFRWMVIDGYGFYKGFFSRPRYLTEKVIPAHLSPYARRVFDQGLGRSIWFATGENIEQVTTMIATFPEARRADLWSGAGFACAYAGSPMERNAFETLRTAAGPYKSQLAIAGALAAKRRHGFGHITPHTELACQVFCGTSGTMAAHIANTTLENIPNDGVEAPSKLWRERIETHFANLTAKEMHSETNV
jgi:enediyne biosynthesis protein E3